MRISVAAVCALATVMANDMVQQAIATPVQPPVDKPVRADTESRDKEQPIVVTAIAPPEQVTIQKTYRHRDRLTVALPEPVTTQKRYRYSDRDRPIIASPSLPAEANQVEHLPFISDITQMENSTPSIPSNPPADPSDMKGLAPDPDPLRIPTQLEGVETRTIVPITLAQALTLAQRNNPELRVAQLELNRNRAALRETRATDLPVVDVNGDATLQQLSASTGGSIAVALGGEVEVNYDLYTSGRRPALIAVAEGQVRAQELEVTVVSQTIQLEVTNRYYGLQEADQQVRITEAAFAEANRSLQDAIALEAAGVGTRFDRLQAEVDVANARQELVLALGQQQIARRQLREQLNIAESVGLTAADPVQMAGNWDSSLEESIILAYQNRAELTQQFIQRDINQQQRRATLADLGPQVALFANLRLQQAFEQGGGPSQTAQVGARVNFNVFDGGARRARVAQEDANVAIAETQVADVRNRVRREVEEAYLALQSNLENTQMADSAVETATEALQLARLRFQGGIGTQGDVSRSQTDLTRAEVNRLQTILNYNRALASLQRAINPKL